MFRIAASGGFSRKIVSAWSYEVAHSTVIPLGSTDITNQVMSCEPSTISNRAIFRAGSPAILVPVPQSEPSSP